jgi:hypothetical protein
LFFVIDVDAEQKCICISEMLLRHGTGGQKMTSEECAKLLIELHSDYQELVGKYGSSVESMYAEAVAMAIMALSEKEGREDGK